MKPNQQTVYLPVSEFNSSERAICTIGIPDLYGDKVVETKGYFFTDKELNEYTQSVIRQALETAAEKAEIINKAKFRGDYNPVVDDESITNTFEETFKKFEV
jgi:hypothetical protein